MKTKKYLTILSLPICWLLLLPIYAQDLDLTSQAQVDAAAGTTVVHGSLLISGTDITDLFGLSELTMVEGNVTISYNPALVELAGLEQLMHLDGYLFIFSNDLLTSLNGLAGLQSIGGSLIIQVNHSLLSIDGLSNLNSVSGITISENDALASLTGLSGITTLSTHLSIALLDALHDLNGLDQLSSVGGYVLISSNASLTNLDGLANLTTVGGALSIYSLPLITNLNGLANIMVVGDYFQVVYNGSLAMCAIDAICADLAPVYEIHDNAPGCNSVEEICPEADLVDLEEMIEDLDLPSGISNGLTSKLEAAEEACNRGNEMVAINNLNAFIHQVEAQSGKKISVEDAEALIAMAEAIISGGLDCGSISPPTFSGPSSRPTNTSWYPNPTNGFIFSNHPFSHAVIYNALGQEVLVQKQGNEIDLSSQKPGVYLIKLDNQVHRVVKL